MKHFIEKIRPVAERYAERNNLKLYDITLQKEKSGRVLRIILDGDVTLDNCAAVSKLISEWIDEQPEDLLPYEKYTLEVTSPGIDRPLKTEADFNSQIGKLARIQTKTKDETGRKNYKGRIKEVSNGSVVIYTEEESTEFIITLADVKKANIEIEL